MPVPGAVILAGGRSRRMGTDKAMVAWDGQPLLSHVVEALRLACTPLVVVHGPRQELPPLKGVTLLPDPAGRVGAGPLAGVLTGLEHLQAAGSSLAFLSGCDAPFVSAAHVRALVDALTPRVVAVAPRDERVQFLSAVVRVEPALAAATTLLSAGERSLRALFDTISLTTLSPEQLPDRRAIRTFNTPEELGALRALRARQDF